MASKPSDGNDTLSPADAVRKLCNNESIPDPKIFENYCKGHLPAADEDFAEAIFQGCTYFKADYGIYQFIENGPGYHAKEIRRRWTAKFHEGKDRILSSGRPALLKDFGAICTAIQNILIHFDEKVSQQVLTDLLKGRPVQNHPTEFMLAEFKNEQVYDPGDDPLAPKRAQ